jgi:hypothetical protein
MYWQTIDKDMLPRGHLAAEPLPLVNKDGLLVPLVRGRRVATLPFLRCMLAKCKRLRMGREGTASRHPLPRLTIVPGGGASLPTLRVRNASGARGLLGSGAKTGSAAGAPEPSVLAQAAGVEGPPNLHSTEFAFHRICY